MLWLSVLCLSSCDWYFSASDSWTGIDTQMCFLPAWAVWHCIETADTILAAGALPNIVEGHKSCHLLLCSNVSCSLRMFNLVVSGPWFFSLEFFSKPEYVCGCMCLYMCMYVSVFEYVCVYVPVSVCMYMSVCVYMCVHMCFMCVCMYMCLYVCLTIWCVYVPLCICVYYTILTLPLLVLHCFATFKNRLNFFHYIILLSTFWILIREIIFPGKNIAVHPDIFGKSFSPHNGKFW